MCLRKDYMTKRLLMHINKIIGTSVGADYAVSKLNVDYKRSQSSVLAGFIIGPSTVTLSRSEGSIALGVEMLRCGSG
jgi:hypothetical protein